VKIAATSTANFPILCTIANLLVLSEDSVSQIIIIAKLIISSEMTTSKRK